MTKMFLAALAGMAVVALYAGERAPGQDRAVHTVASSFVTRGTSSIKINTSCDMSGYMVAVG